MKLKHLFENKVPNITNPHEAYCYAEKQGKRIPELEHLIIQLPDLIFFYANDIIKGRWPEAESIILNSKWANDYLKRFPEVRTSNKDVPVMLGDLVIIDLPNTATDDQLRKLITLLFPSAINDSKVIERIIRKRVYVESTILEHVANKYSWIRDLTFLKQISFSIFCEMIGIYQITETDFDD